MTQQEHKWTRYAECLVQQYRVVVVQTDWTAWQVTVYLNNEYLWHDYRKKEDQAMTAGLEKVNSHKNRR